jgi:hypothetical protein
MNQNLCSVKVVREQGSDELLSSAAAEKLSALMTVEHLRERAQRAKREDFVRFLDSSPDVPPMAGDEL